VKNQFALFRRSSNSGVCRNEETLLVGAENPDKAVFRLDDVMTGGKLLPGNVEGKRHVNYHITGARLACREPYGREHSRAESNPNESHNFPPQGNGLHWPTGSHGEDSPGVRRNAV
jgi:hypothetical protein